MSTITLIIKGLLFLVIMVLGNPPLLVFSVVKSIQLVDNFSYKTKPNLIIKKSWTPQEFVINKTLFGKIWHLWKFLMYSHTLFQFSIQESKSNGCFKVYNLSHWISTKDLRICQEEIREKYAWQLHFMAIHTSDCWINVRQVWTQTQEWPWLRQ